QDMKALIPADPTSSEFLFRTLKVLSAHILSKVGTAAHGTKRLEQETVEGLPVIVARDEDAEAFQLCVDRVRNLRGAQLCSFLESERNFHACLQRAFRGDL